MTDRLHVFIGTKAQYIKTAPLLRLMDAKGVDYRLIDSGQHAKLAQSLRTDLGVRDPDVRLGGSADVNSIPAAVAWATRIATRLGSGTRVRQELFGGDGGICVVHGDTPSTLLSALLARRAGLRVAHLEAGLRSHSLWHPFPEELIRLAVMRISGLLFAPDATAVKNLREMKVRGRVIPVSANTVVEALDHALSAPVQPASGPAVVTMHRVENLTNRRRVDGFVGLACRIAEQHGVRFVLHGPTEETIRKGGHDATLRAAGVQLSPLLAHRQFAPMLAAAPLVVTDGGSIQEECALLGVPTLLWRDRTERPDGLGANVVLSHYDEATVAAFLSDPERLRRPPAASGLTPSEQILEVLVDELSAPARRR
jgi:UDP-N-acetylglucosamine 2-epimerase (non-hydrolysing)